MVPDDFAQRLAFIRVRSPSFCSCLFLPCPRSLLSCTTDGLHPRNDGLKGRPTVLVAQDVHLVNHEERNVPEKINVVLPLPREAVPLLWSGEDNMRHCNGAHGLPRFGVPRDPSDGQTKPYKPALPIVQPFVAEGLGRGNVNDLVHLTKVLGGAKGRFLEPLAL